MTNLIETIHVTYSIPRKSTLPTVTTHPASGQNMTERQNMILIIIIYFICSFIYVESINVFTSFCVKCFNVIFLLHSFRLIHSLLLIPFSLIPIATSCIHEFRELPFLLLPGGHYYKYFGGSLSSLIPHPSAVSYVI